MAEAIPTKGVLGISVYYYQRVGRKVEKGKNSCLGGEEWEREVTGEGNIQVRRRRCPLRQKGLSLCGYNPLSRHLQLGGLGERLRLSVGPVG